MEAQIDKKDLHIGCICCSSAALKAPMNMTIAVGFGSACVTRDGQTVYDENLLDEEAEYWTVQDAENAASADPDHDWRIIKFGPLYGKTFQRHGDGNWVCIESNPGFA